MPTLNRRDQAQAYAFLRRRQAAALVLDEPDAPDAPMRKLGVATFSSMMVAVLAVAAAGVFGLLRPSGGVAWRNGQSLIVEKDTGTRYIYTGGALHPILNYASARLVLRQSAFSITSVPASALRAARRGLPIGIPGAPEELPVPATIVHGPWTVCSLPSLSPAGTVSPYVRLSVGQQQSGSPLTADRGLLVEGLDGTAYLLWNDHRLRVPGGTGALTALSYASASPLPAGDAWLSALPQGPDLAAPAVPAAGRSGQPVDGRQARVGQVYATGTGTSSQYYLELRDGLAPITPVQAYLLLATPALRRLYPAGRPGAIPVTAVAAAAVRSAATLAAPGLPAIPPPLANTGNGQLAACATYTPGGVSLPSLWTAGVPTASAAQALAGTPADSAGLALADQVRVPPGGGVVAQSVPAPGVTGGVMYVVTDEGIKYPLADASALTPLGLAGVAPARLPSALLGLLRTGPALDIKAAARTVSP